MKLNFHSDPGHGWLECPIEFLSKYGIKPSEYSYITLSKVYLEEDCDAGLLIDAVKKTGEKVEFNEVMYDESCFIRNLPRIKKSA